MRRLVLAATMAMLVALPQPAVAHASLVSSDPADGATVKSAPRSIRLTFNEDVRLADVSVTAPNGGVVGTTEPEIDGAQVTVALVPTNQRGEYDVDYRVLSADDHAVAGELRFTTTTGQTLRAPQPPADASSGGGRGAAVVVLGIVGALIAALAIRARQREKRS